MTGRGVQKGRAAVPKGVGSYPVDMLPKVMLELVVNDSDTQIAIDTIIQKVRTEDIGDGKFFVNPVADGIRVRTGEPGGEAL